MADREATDFSNGYERVAAEFLAGRGSAPPTAIGASTVRKWARSVHPGAVVLDVGCGTGLPITKVLVDEDVNVFGVDAAPSLVAAFRDNLPGVPVACEAVETSSFFGRTFDAVLSWGVVFLLPSEEQRRFIHRAAAVLNAGGRLLFTTCSIDEPCVWADAMTGLESRSLGRVEYRRQLEAAGFRIVAEYDDEGANHYFDAVKAAR